MAYVVNQLNQPKIDLSDPSATAAYMTLVTEGVAKRRVLSDTGINSKLVFYDECLYFENSLTANSVYYFHAKIKRLLTTQKFYIYLVKYNNTKDTRTQYLKTIEIQPGGSNDWADFEIIFSPLINFDCILFQLQRAEVDYSGGTTRYPTIVYEELSLINNIINTKIGKADTELLKIGVQSAPGLIMCINQEEIHVGRSGIYELRNGAISIDFFSVVSAAQENKNGSNPLKVNGVGVDLEQYLNYVAKKESSSSNMSSECIFSNSKLRDMNPYVLDYIYKEE